MSNPFGVGQMLYGRGMGTQLVGLPLTDPPRAHWSPKDFVRAVKWVMQVRGIINAVIKRNMPPVFIPLHPIPTAYPVGPGGPVSPSPLTPNAGYYPSGTGAEHSGHPHVSLLMGLALAEAVKRIGQQAHSPSGSESGEGAGTSTAPERMFLHGMKHWYDMVAGQR